MGPRALTASIGLAPWSMTMSKNRVKNFFLDWGSGGLAPLGCLPLWGREGVTLLCSPEQRADEFYKAVIR